MEPGSPPAASQPAAEPAGPRWTNRKMAEFLRTLAATHSVKDAARSVGMSRQSAYRLRSRLKGKAFAAAWDQAFRHSYDNLPYAALERALHGVEMPHYYKGELIGTSRRYNEQLTVTLLKMISSEKVLLLDSDVPGAEQRGHRFEELVASVERDGDAARDTSPAPFSAAGFGDLSPLSDGALMAKLRGSRRYRRG